MSLLSLNFDVLEAILSFVESRDALPLMTTCRALHVPAMRRHLFEITLRCDRLRESKKTMKFCKFILGDPQARARHLRALTLLLNHQRLLASPVSDHLAEVIRHATGLRRIVLDGAGDNFFDSAPALTDALADVESLKTIRLTFVGPRGIALLSRMKSQPRTVQCRVNIAYARQPWQGPTQFLHNFVRSLTVLELHDALDLLTVETESHVVWPRVQELALMDENVKREHWQFICRAFPNLRTLRMDGTLIDTAGAYAEWSEMDLVQTSNPLPLRCRVRCVELNISLDKQFLSPHNVADYLEMLGNCLPIALICHLNRCILDYLPVLLHRLRFLHLETYDLEPPAPRLLSSVTRWVDATLLSLASTLARSRVRAVIVELPHNCTTKRAELRSHAENIATHARCMELIGLHRHGYKGSTLRQVGDLRDWRFSLCNWYHVTSRTTDGTPQLSRVSEVDVPRLVPLVQSCKTLE
ncbi:uncharacterized protein B0H18DRAFT_1120828 [Fomitopsis serialis]|uniref:uncharacterized protein n=1 Tax=Fomitopsis serialis TaxID=139415 RepID=UPI002007FC66|nr:uncharacterized protein B0H18DRAFT_1120828 [Neoantrodia serialis]KAH9922656.1 hypothetical protein B0H18DRAFT_1120828 [Neoantrodia serialis]